MDPRKELPRGSSPQGPQGCGSRGFIAGIPACCTRWTASFVHGIPSPKAQVARRRSGFRSTSAWNSRRLIKPSSAVTVAPGEKEPQRSCDAPGGPASRWTRAIDKMRPGTGWAMSSGTRCRAWVERTVFRWAGVVGPRHRNADADETELPKYGGTGTRTASFAGNGMVHRVVERMVNAGVRKCSIARRGGLRKKNRRWDSPRSSSAHCRRNIPRPMDFDPGPARIDPGPFVWFRKSEETRGHWRKRSRLKGGEKERRDQRLRGNPGGPPLEVMANR